MRPAMPRDNFEKHDRLIRLMRELALFQAQPRGLTTAQIAQKLDVSQRQAQRDIAALESEFHVPFVKQGTRWTLVGGFFLPPGNLPLPAALGLGGGGDLAGGGVGASFPPAARIVAAEDVGARVGDLDVRPPGGGGAAVYAPCRRPRRGDDVA